MLNRQEGEFWGKSTNQEPRRETRGEKTPNIKPALKFPQRVSQGEVETSSHLGLITSTQREGLLMGKVQGLEI